MIALKTTFDPAAAAGLRASYELRLGEDRFRLEVAAGRLELERGGADGADAIIETDGATFRSLVFGGRQLAEAVRSGSFRAEGDGEAVARLLRLFPRPTPAPVPAT